MARTRILELSSIIAENTAIVDDFCTENQISSPSLDVNDPPIIRVPPNRPDVSVARDNVAAATRELGQLMQEPASIGADMGFIDAFALHAISRFSIATHVPVGSEISYEDLSRLCGMAPSALSRIVRFAITNGVFREDRLGYVSHTSLSRVLAESENVRCCSAFTYDEVFPAAAKATDALQQHPGSEEPTESGWGLINAAKQPLFEELHECHPTRYRNATVAMNTWGSDIPATPILQNYPWHAVNTMIDIGGGHGPVSQSIAEHYQNLNCVVQDLGGVIREGRTKLPPELRSRISFMEHNMFEEQPVKDADVYFFRFIFHDWPDKQCVDILKALTPALKPGARVVINDACMTPPGRLPPTPSRAKRMWDLSMMILFNARDREEDEWASLFHRADTRFKFLGSRLPDKNVEGLSPTFLLSIIEAVWEP